MVVPVAYRGFHGTERVPAIAGIDPLAPILLSILCVAENERGLRRRGVTQRLGDYMRRDPRVPAHDFLWRLHQSSLISMASVSITSGSAGMGRNFSFGFSADMPQSFPIA